MNHGDLTSQFDQSSSGTIFTILASLLFVVSEAAPLTSLTINDLISIYFQEIQSLRIVFLDLDSWDLYSSVCMGHGYCLCYSYLGDFCIQSKKKKKCMSKSNLYSLASFIDRRFIIHYRPWHFVLSYSTGKGGFCICGLVRLAFTNIAIAIFTLIYKFLMHILWYNVIPYKVVFKFSISHVGV